MFWQSSLFKYASNFASSLSLGHRECMHVNQNEYFQAMSHKDTVLEKKTIKRKGHA